MRRLLGIRSDRHFRLIALKEQASRDFTQAAPCPSILFPIGKMANSASEKGLLKIARAKFFSVIGKYKTIDNPISLAKIDQVIEALHLSSGARVLDIASGKAEMLCRIAARYGARGIGVERSAYFCAEAIDRVEKRGLSNLISVQQMEGHDFSAPEASFDVTMCIGAEWIFGGLRETIASLTHWTKPGGTIAVGTPFWSAEPPQAYLEQTGFTRERFSDHAGNVTIGEGIGLKLVYTAVGNSDEWDYYASLSWLAAYDFVRDNPDDPDVAEIIEQTEKDKASYMRYQRDCLGWAIYLFRKPA